MPPAGPSAAVAAAAAAVAVVIAVAVVRSAVWMEFLPLKLEQG